MGQGLDVLNFEDFTRLFNRLSFKYNLQLVNSEKLIELYDVLNAQYDYNHRSYHNKNHIRNMINNLYFIGTTLNNNINNTLYMKWYECKDEIELAIWFHDVIYVPHDIKNENNSVILTKCFIEYLFNKNDSANVLLRKLEKLILSTTPNYIFTGRKETEDFDVTIIRDLDLLGFAANTYEEFLKHQKNVGEELKINSLNNEHIKFYESVLAMDNIYKLDKVFQYKKHYKENGEFYWDKYQSHEWYARNNLKRFLEEIDNEFIPL